MDHHFKPGNKLSRGRPKKPDAVKALIVMDRLTVQAALSDAMKLPACLLDRKIENVASELSSLQLAAFTVMKLATTGDLDAFNFILDRTIGKPKEDLTLRNAEADSDAAHNHIIDIVPRERLIQLLQIKMENTDDGSSGDRQDGGGDPQAPSGE